SGISKAAEKFRTRHRGRKEPVPARVRREIVKEPDDLRFVARRGAPHGCRRAVAENQAFAVEIIRGGSRGRNSVHAEPPRAQDVPRRYAGSTSGVLTCTCRISGGSMLPHVMPPPGCQHTVCGN